MNRAQVVEQLPGLRRYARALTGNAWAADDLVQDTLERACRKWLLWRSGSDLRAWLFTLMHNLYLNQRRGLPVVQPMDEQALATPAGTDSQLDDTAIDLDRCLQRLPAEQRAVLLLVTLEDMAYADVARVLGIPVGTVMSRLSRARSRMRDLMDQPPAHTAHANATPAVALRRMK